MVLRRMKPAYGFLLCSIGLLSFVFLSGCEKAGAPSPSAAAAKIITTSSGVEMVFIPAGDFKMGAAGWNEDEAPVHAVKIGAFLMDRTEVTQEQYAKMEMPDPSHFKNPKNPVEQVNWPQAAQFCNRRSEAEGLKPCYNEATAECDYEAPGYRLPTEAEWEYACRAGTSGAYSFGDDPLRLGEYAWFADNASKKTHLVAQKKPNPWGLYDIYGNVSEWCNDVYDKGYYAASPQDNPRGPAKGKMYILRGGAWTWRADQIRSSARMPDSPGFADTCLARDAIGFRCVRKAPPELLSMGK
ncbi:MAG: SUMF1/EgtB/PvdO family nonheme iron enzyme [Candidatus Sumerlaeota bacterium]|nr:SUMF1/EgtB/PvdO family nonheme iron enzyme [Candidatus Sumerlaeota bacterium]